MAKRSTLICWIAFFTIAVFSLVESQSVHAQGIFRRLQQRIQSRAEPILPGPQTARPNAADPTLQRLSPVDSDRGQVSGEQPSGSGSPSSQGTANRSRLGGSVLSGRGGDEPSGDGNAASKPSMGIQVVPVNEGTRGLRVAGIRPGSRAGQAGLQQDDLIVAIDGTATPTVDAIAGILQRRKVGDTIRATVLRNQRTTSVRIPLIDARNVSTASAEQSPSGPSVDEVAGGSAASLKLPVDATAVDFGADVEEIPGKRGVLLSAVRPGSAAAGAGLQVGDRIVSIDGRLIQDPASFQRELAQHASGDELVINAVRNETLNTYDVVLKSVAAPESNVVAQSSASSPDAGPTDADQPLANQGVPSAGSKETARSNEGGPLLGGLRSALGGLFGGTAPGDQPVQPAVDTLELGDDEPIERVGFEEEMRRPSKADPASASPSDPPSIEELTAPAAELPEALPPQGETNAVQEADNALDERDQVIRELREEIRRLKQRLDELEADRSNSQ